MAKSGSRPRPVEERFWAKVDKNGPAPEHRPDLGPCWVRGGNSAAYTSLHVGGRGTPRVRAHRLAWELLVGPIPEGLEPDHLCRVPACVKAITDEHGPAHLELVTHRENMLRGETFAARNVVKTHCKYGHPFDEANTYRNARGQRWCRACAREWQRQYRQARRR